MSCHQHPSLLRHVEPPARTHLNEQVEVALVVIRGGRSVAAHDLLAIDLCLDRDVLANG